MSQLLSDIITLILTISTGFFALYGIKNNYRDSQNNITRAGKIAIWGGAVSILLNLMNSAIKNFIDKDKAIAENRRINDQLENQKQILVNIGSTLNEVRNVQDKLSKSFELQTEELEVAGKSLNKQELSLAQQHIAVENIEKVLQTFDPNNLSITMSILIPIEHSVSLKRLYDSARSHPRIGGSVFIEDIEEFLQEDDNKDDIVNCFTNLDIRLNFFSRGNNSTTGDLSFLVESKGISINENEYEYQYRNRLPYVKLYTQENSFLLFVNQQMCRLLIQTKSGFCNLKDILSSNLQVEFQHGLNSFEKKILTTNFYRKGTINTLFVANRFVTRELYGDKDFSGDWMGFNKRYDSKVSIGKDFK